MATLRRSLVINFFSSSGAAFLQFLVSVILARLLAPNEIGVFSMTVVIVNVAHIFRDFGVASYVQREPDLTVEKMRSAIGVMLASSWTICVLLFTLSGALARWFGEPGMAPVMRVLALGFFVIPFGSITNSLLVRRFAADKQALVSAASTITYCTVCLTLATCGFGTMSLAWANLVSLVVTALALLPLRPPGMPWLPGLAHWRAIVHFGLGTLLVNCTTAVNNAIPDLLLGKLGNARLVGLLSRANSTVSIFGYVAGSTVTYGAVSYLSQAHHRGESLAPVVARATALLTGVAWPAFACTALLGADIVLALYGQGWRDSVPAILPLTVSAAVAMVFHYTPSALIALGRPYLGALPVLVMLVSRIGFGYVLYDGRLASFAWAICLATLAATPVMWWQQRRHLGMGRLVQALAPSMAVTLACGLTCCALQYLLPLAPGATRLLAMALPLVLAWYGALRLTRHVLVNEVHHLGAGLLVRLKLRPVGGAG
jgi:O-antigen/teichoic acid export membrane protein